MNTVVHSAATRGNAHHGWLTARHSFSFAHYYNPERMNFGLLRVLNDDIVQGGMGFGTHPHDNMEIVTIPLEGDLAHKDSMGHTSVIKQGDVQIMSAGTGVTHSEFNHNKDQLVNLLQLWVFPKERDIEPRYDQKTYAAEDRQNKLQTVVAPDDDTALWVNQDVWFHLGNYEEGKVEHYAIRKEGNGVYLFVIEGSIEVDGQLLGKRDAIGISHAKDFQFKATSADTRVLLIDVPMQQ